MAIYNYDNQLRQNQEALNAVIQMRRKHAELKSGQGDAFMLFLIVCSCLVSFLFKSELSAFAAHLHNTWGGGATAHASTALSKVKPVKVAVQRSIPHSGHKAAR
jgi:hypothetical protein